MESLPATPAFLPDVSALVVEGNAALLAGDAYSARQRFRQALDHDPGCVEAWLGLAGSVRPYREKFAHLQQALTLDPNHTEARTALAHVTARLAAGEVLAPSGVQSHTTSAAAEPPSLAPTPATTLLTCYIHPTRETGLRCTSCDRPICSDCARPAVVGQLCPDCAKVRRPINYQVTAGHLALAGGITLIYSAIFTTLGLLLLGSSGMFGFIIAFFLGPALGELLVRLLDRLMHAKRGRSLQVTVGVAYGLGVLLLVVGLALVGGMLSLIVVGMLLFSLPLGLYLLIGMAMVTALARLR